MQNSFRDNSESESVLLHLLKAKLILSLGEVTSLFKPVILPLPTVFLNSYGKQLLLKTGPSGIARIKESLQVEFHSTDFIYQFGFAITTVSVFFHWRQNTNFYSNTRREHS